MTTHPRAATYAGLLAAGTLETSGRKELHRQWLAALVPVAAVLALGAAWATAAPLSGAVVAPGQVKVELNRKTVQHQEGGIVREILVRDGQKVRAGDPLVVIGDLRSNAELAVLQDQLVAARVRQARLVAEAALESRFAPPAELAHAAAAAPHVAQERALFAARRRTLDEQIASLEAQIREASAQGAALGAQIEATEAAAKLSVEELEINEKLARDGYVQRTRLLGLQRAVADYRARVGEYRSDLAAARQRAGEVQSRIVQTRNVYQQQAADELKEVVAKARELEERVRPSQDQVERQLVRAPVDGEVMNLRVAAVGAAIGPREPLLDVVPAHEKLVVEARIRPEDIDYVRRDGAADVRLASLDARHAPLLPGKVVFVSPDRVTRPETRESWFVATIEVDAATLAGQANVRLQAGMPAEVFVTTSPRTLVQYLLQPFDAFANRAMREP